MLPRLVHNFTYSDCKKIPSKKNQRHEVGLKAPAKEVDSMGKFQKEIRVGLFSRPTCFFSGLNIDETRDHVHNSISIRSPGY